jgi:3-oxo-5alpha-steroid 4-dehydrogenase
VGKPAEYVRPVGAGPYWMLNVSIEPSLTNPCPMFTVGGLVVDEGTGAVRDTHGEEIRGLYAAGRTAAGICVNSYVSGLSLSDCIFSGRRAGRSAAGEASVVEGVAGARSVGGVPEGGA